MQIKACWRAALALTVCAAPLLSTPVAARELLAVGAHFDRVYERGADGTFSGLGAEILRLLARESGDTIRFEIYPWKRAQAMVSGAKADILVGPYLSDERRQTLAFSERPFYQDAMIFYARSDAPPWNGDYASIRGKQVAILNGWAYGPQFERASSQLQISLTNTVESGLKMLTARRIDLFATNRRNTEPLIAQLQLAGQVVPLNGIIDIQNGYMAFPKRPEYDSLRLRFDQAYKKLADSGELKKLGRRLDVVMP